MKKVLLILAMIGLLFPNFAFLAEEDFDVLFSPNYIISDYELEDYSSMTLNDINYFLSRHNGILKYYITANPNTEERMSAATIIYEASQTYKINPKYLLVLLQKEQSLITNPSPSIRALDWATGYAICDSCSMTNPALQKYRGFYNQIMYAAERNRFYIENKDQPWLFRIGQEYLIDGHIITPSNQATACLYNYTPHLNGNYNFWKIWNKWFTRKYPNGSILKEIGSPGVWLIENGKRNPFITWTAFVSRYDPRGIIEIHHNDLIKYLEGPAIKFSSYSYLRTPDAQVYMLDLDKLRPFASEEVRRYFGVNPEEIIDITWEDANYYTQGDPITMDSMYPAGALLKYDNHIFYVKNGYKHPIISQEILDINFGGQCVINVSEDELNFLTEGVFMKIKNGILVKSEDNNSVYVISDGERRPIQNAEIFESLGYNWSDIIELDENVLLIHKLGEAIEEPKQDILEEELLPENQESIPL